jgi:hypothetical protein
VGRRRLDGGRSEAEAFRIRSGRNGWHAEAGALASMLRSSMFFLTEIGNGDGSSLIWTQEGVRDIEGSKSVTEMQRRKQEKACWRWQPSPSSRTPAMVFSFYRERGRAEAS